MYRHYRYQRNPIYNFRNDVITIYTTIMYIYGNSIVSVVRSNMIQFKTTAHTKVNFTLRAPDLGLGILALFGPWGDFFVCTYFASLSIGRMMRKVFPKEMFLWECIPHPFFEKGKVKLVVGTVDWRWVLREMWPCLPYKSHEH